MGSNRSFVQKTVSTFFFNQLIIPPNHAVICSVKIALYAVSFKIIDGGVIITGAGEAVAALYNFKFHIPVVYFSLPNAGNGLRISKGTGQDTCAKQKKENRFFQMDSRVFII